MMAAATQSCKPVSTGNTVGIIQHMTWTKVLLSVIGILMSIATFPIYAQGVYMGDVDYPFLGIRLTIPSGWKGEESGDYLILASDTEPGLIGLTSHEAKAIEELKSVADQGWIDEGISMMRSGEFTQLGAEGMGAEFSGFFQGEKAKAFIASVINPFGNSVTIIALTSESAYSNRQATLVREIAESLKFSMPKEAPMNASWRESLPGHQLTSLFSSYSSDTPYYDSSGQVYGSYSSYSSRSTIHLCSNGSFYSNSSTSASFDSVGGFGNLHNGGQNQGQWQVATSAQGQSLLRLTYADGSVSERLITTEDGKTFLDGNRYYRTDSDACL